jgi:hypothetical protein
VHCRGVKLPPDSVGKDFCVSRRYMVEKMTKVFAFCGCYLLSTIGAMAESADHASLLVEWQDICDEALVASYFSLEISSDGSVKYSGYHGVRKLGEYREQIAILPATSFIRNAEKDARRFRGRHSHIKHNQQILGDCLHLTIRGAAQKIEERVPLNSGFGRKLERDIRKIVDFKKWTCPAKESVPNQELYCEHVSLAYSYYDRESCEMQEMVSIQDDGRFHYDLSGIKNSDSFGKITRTKLTKIRRLAVEIGKKEGDQGVILQLAPALDKSERSPKPAVPKHTVRYWLEGGVAAEFRSRLITMLDVAPMIAQPSAACKDDSRRFPIMEIEINK